MRDKSVSVPVPNQKKSAPCNVHEAPESVNLSVRHHHHQTVAELWNVDVKMDMHDMLITQEGITVPHRTVRMSRHVVQCPSDDVYGK